MKHTQKEIYSKFVSSMLVEHNLIYPEEIQSFSDYVMREAAI